MKRFLFLIGILWIISCEDKSGPPDEPVLDWTNLDLSQPFETGRTDIDGIDEDKLNDGIEAAMALNNFYSIAIVYKGRLVIEDYKYGGSTTAYPVWSVTKSVLSALMGIAIHNEIFESEDQPFASFFPNLTDSTKGEITIAQLLTMSSGIPDNTSYMNEAYPLNFILDQELEYAPGTWWNYTSAGTHVLSYIFSAGAKESAKSFGEKYLFSKLDIKHYSWIQDAYGVSNGGFGLNMRLKDMAKFGQLFLQNGVSNGENIVDPDWVNKSTEMIIPFNNEKTNGYGYLWWIRINQGIKIYFAAGYGGQYIMVIPSKALVVAITSSSQYSNEYGPNLNRIIYEEIVGSFSRVDLQ